MTMCAKCFKVVEAKLNERAALLAEREHLRAELAETAALLCCGEWGTGSGEHGEDCPVYRLKAEREELVAFVERMTHRLGSCRDVHQEARALLARLGKGEG